MSDILDYFPHNDFRYSQRDILKEVDEVIRSDSHKFVLIEAATGNGKTALAGTSAKAYPDAYYLAEQKIHQEQVKEEFPDDTVVCKGQLNYNCGEARDPPCKDSVPVYDVQCERKPNAERDGEFAGESSSRGDLFWPRGLDESERCPYMCAKTAGMEAPIACLNYSYFFNETYYSEDFGKRNILICDEAHNIEQAMQSFLTFRVDEFVQEELGLTLKDRGGEIQDWVDWITGHLEQAAGARLDEMNQHVLSLYENDRPIEQEFLYKRDTLDEVICNIHRFENEYFDGLEWAVEREFDENNNLEHVKFSPVTIAPFAERFLFDYADTVIMMSATMLDIDILLRSLGLSNRRDECYYFNVGSIFSPENRKVHYYDAPRVNRDKWEEAFPQTCKIIDRICRRKHPNDKGIIHSVSYKNEKAILENVSEETRRRLIYHHGDENRDDILEDFKKMSGNQILMSPAMYEGVDLKYDLSRFQIIPKVPFLSLGSQRVRLRKDMDPMWYDWRTAIRLIQSFGRSVRAPDDWAETYIVDGSFDWFYDRYKDKFFPDYVNESIEKDNLMELLGVSM